MISAFMMSDVKSSAAYFGINSVSFGHVKTYEIGLGSSRVWLTFKRPAFVERMLTRLSYAKWRLQDWWQEHNGPYRWTKFKLMLTGDYAPYYVNVYSVDRCYGGSEEGGWWYDAGTPLPEYFGTASFKAMSEEDAILLRDSLRGKIEQPPTMIRDGVEVPHIDRYSMIGDADIEVVIEDLPAAPYPTSRPHYC